MAATQSCFYMAEGILGGGGHVGLYRRIMYEFSMRKSVDRDSGHSDLHS